MVIIVFDVCTEVEIEKNIEKLSTSIKLPSAKSPQKIYKLTFQTILKDTELSIVLPQFNHVFGLQDKLELMNEYDKMNGYKLEVTSIETTNNDLTCVLFDISNSYKGVLTSTKYKDTLFKQGDIFFVRIK
jgi:hypothetical protein